MFACRRDSWCSFVMLSSCMHGNKGYLEPSIWAVQYKNNYNIGPAFTMIHLNSWAWVLFGLELIPEHHCSLLPPTVEDVYVQNRLQHLMKLCLFWKLFGLIAIDPDILLSWEGCILGTAPPIWWAFAHPVVVHSSTMVPYQYWCSSIGSLCMSSVPNPLPLLVVLWSE